MDEGGAGAKVGRRNGRGGEERMGNIAKVREDTMIKRGKGREEWEVDERRLWK